MTRGEAVLHAIAQSGGSASSWQIARKLGCSVTTARRMLRASIDSGDVRRVTHWVSRYGYTRLYQARVKGEADHE